MRPHTVHALAQMVRHTRGLVTTIEKWVANTPADALEQEIHEAISVVRGALAELNTTIGSLRLDEPHRPDAAENQQ